ncbi:MAG TPA: exosortase/archaeosortase family protein [Candidatus Diapherotrites archaeon]|uniref:Exosortase/archaeosortase family protein n=1 Tax=Candidatus Iainarchaeum sp. TaxID=3101447 RepID=A0A7J4IWG1_9ARCH|nr:exosortase/archaeosortase family protein [Candidatus Diapherotrites archaeon]
MGQNDAAFFAGKFLFGIAVLFIIFSYLLSLVPQVWFGMFYANAALAALQPFGISGTVENSDPVQLRLGQLNDPLGFGYLCTGILEMALVWAAVLATPSVGLRERIRGAAAAVGVIAAFNLLRIVATILILVSLGLGAASFSHDIFFRMFLFLTIAGYYYAWLRFAKGATISKTTRP